MDMSRNSGFREVEHTADVEIEVWGEDLSALFRQAARGMYHLSKLHTPESDQEDISQSFRIRERDIESLLVAFLSELLFYLETERLMFHTMDLGLLKDHQLHAQLEGSRITDQDREIKAVTFHDLEILEDESGWKVNIVFDV